MDQAERKADGEGLREVAGDVESSKVRQGQAGRQPEGRTRKLGGTQQLSRGTKKVCPFLAAHALRIGLVHALALSQVEAGQSAPSTLLAVIVISVFLEVRSTIVGLC